jgi:hypothetical protein
MAKAGNGTARFWHHLFLLALTVILYVLLGLRAVGRLMRGRWASGLIGLAIVIPLALFAFHSHRAWRATGDSPQSRQTASAPVGAPQALGQASNSDEDEVDAASIQEWRKAVKEVLKEAKAGQRPAARETGAGAVVARTEEKPQGQEIGQTASPQEMRPPEQSTQEGKKPEADAAREPSPIAGGPGGPAADTTSTKEAAGSPADLGAIKPESGRFWQGGEAQIGRRFRGGRHYRGAWSYRIHTPGNVRQGPVLTYLAR